MKKIYIPIAILATASLVSCVKEQSFNEFAPLGENAVAFALNGVSTKSTSSDSRAEKGLSIPIGNSESGESLFLEETIEELNPTPSTKGAPAYTVNVGTLYKTMGVYAAGDFGDTIFEDVDEYEHKYDPKDSERVNGWRFSHYYESNPWPGTSAVDFYLRMPASDDGVVIDATDENAINGFTYNNTDKTIEFDYLSEYNGVNQKDILFGQTTITKDQHDGYLPNGAPVLMYHALTGVKFRTGNDNGGRTKTIITKVEFTGIAASGHCTITPSTGAVVWSELGTKNGTFELGFSNPTYSESSDNTIDYGDYNASSSKFGQSWYSAAADDNLNNEDGTLTFWFIPQSFSSTNTTPVTLKITFCIKTPDTSGAQGGGVITHTIDLSSKLNDVEWKAGQLRTYTLEPREVDVKIVDEMTSGWVKENLHVTNTGNVHEYVRMTFLGNWYDKDGNIVVGYKYAGNESGLTQAQKDEMVLPWYGGGYKGLDPAHPNDYVDPYGYFDDTFLLAALPDGSKWVRASGGYYYTEAIGPGNKLDPATQALFKSYTLTSIPTIYVPSPEHEYRVPAEGVHLVMEVSIQAIYAPMNADGTEETSNWQQEWYEATGNEKLKPTTSN